MDIEEAIREEEHPKQKAAVLATKKRALIKNEALSYVYALLGVLLIALVVVVLLFGVLIVFME